MTDERLFRESFSRISRCEWVNKWAISRSVTKMPECRECYAPMEFTGEDPMGARWYYCLDCDRTRAIVGMEPDSDDEPLP
jgi:hypothetical protein